MAAAHSAGAAIAQAVWGGETGGALYDLTAGEVFPVSLYLIADPDIARVDLPFTVIVEAKDTPY